jgi:endoglycosylceramidase
VTKSIVNTAAAYNVSTLLDAHQDCLAEIYCGGKDRVAAVCCSLHSGHALLVLRPFVAFIAGEGAPTWAVTLNDTELFNSFPLPFAAPFVRDNVTLLPSNDDCAKLSWSLYQGTFAGMAAYQQLYDSRQSMMGAPLASTLSVYPFHPVVRGVCVAANPLGMREEFGLFWKQVADTFKDVDAVVGYELINEPFAGNAWKDWDLVWPWEADARNLQVRVVVCFPCTCIRAYAHTHVHAGVLRSPSTTVSRRRCARRTHHTSCFSSP